MVVHDYVANMSVNDLRILLRSVVIVILVPCTRIERRQAAGEDVSALVESVHNIAWTSILFDMHVMSDPPGVFWSRLHRHWYLKQLEKWK